MNIYVYIYTVLALRQIVTGLLNVITIYIIIECQQCWCYSQGLVKLL